VKATECKKSEDCKFDKDFDCLRFTAPDGNFMDMYCAQKKCKKISDCSTLDDSKLKHKPGKCEKKECNYDYNLFENMNYLD
jgi:hypothetical protein